MVAFTTPHRIAISGDRRELGPPGKAADAGHVSLDAFAQVLQQMKAISDLSGLRRSLPNALCIKTAAVAADDFDFWMLLDPIRSLFGGAGFEHVCYDPTFEIDNDRSVIETFAPAPVINRDRAPRSAVATFLCMTFELPQNRIVADGHRRSRQQPLACPAAGGVAEQPHEVCNALCFSREKRSPVVRRKSFVRISRSSIATARGATQERLERLGSEGLAGTGRASYDALSMLLHTRGMTLAPAPPADTSHRFSLNTTLRTTTPGPKVKFNFFVMPY